MRRPAPLTMTSLLATIAVAAISAASCATTSSPPGPGQSSSTQPRSSQTPSATPTTSSTLANCTGGWRTASLTVTRQVAVPPVPVGTAIRTGSHPNCRFDRLVIDISGAMPGYYARFVTNVIQDASGKPVAMPGTSFLEITLKPAQAHQADGTLTLPRKVQAVGYPMLKGYAVAGDFEAVLSIALGLAGGSRYRVGELPGRLYIDVAW